MLITCRWLSVRLETLGALAALAAALLTVEQRGNASTFGLVLSYALSITMLTSMTVSPLQAPGGLLTLHQILFLESISSLY